MKFDMRAAEQKDHDALGLIMYRAIREGPSPYTQAQRAAWCPRAPAGADWSDRLARQSCFAAHLDGQAVGFMTVDATGYIDLAYILVGARGQGLFSGMLAKVEKKAEQLNLKRLTTHASLMAQPAFLRCGFETVHHEEVERHGQILRRALMVKGVD